MGKLITIANRKGGVGKTTLALALAETFVFEHHKSTAIVDLDPQSSASEILLSTEEFADRLETQDTLPHFLRRKTDGEEPKLEQFLAGGKHMLRDRHNVDLAIVPNSPELWDLEYDVLRSGLEAPYRVAVRALLTSLLDRFKVVIVDTPPGKTMAAEEAVLASDVVLCPIVPERLSVWGMDKMKAYFEELEQQHEVPPWRFVVSRLESNRNEAQAQVATIMGRYVDHFITERQGLPGFRREELIGLDKAEQIIKRIALFRDEPNKIKTLEQFYGPAATQQLRKIATQLDRIPKRNA
jgi:cellulose biosynthesis protein BcsQ